MTTSALRARVGAPEDTSKHEVEGMTIECWLYGAGATTGTYQLCFANDRLRSKVEYTL